MNNKGFTLIELIIIIAILSMLALISTPNVIKMIEKNKVDNYNGVIDSIIKATEIYVSDNRYKLSFDDSCKPGDTKDVYASITLQNLIDSKDISSEVKNSCTDKSIYNSTSIKITLSCKTKQFSYDIVESTSNNTLERKSGVSGIAGLKIPDGSNCSYLY